MFFDKQDHSCLVLDMVYFPVSRATTGAKVLLLWRLHF
jgi:hypothetical protein